MTTETRVLEKLAQLPGVSCWSVMVGGAEDPALVLDFGKRRRRSLRLANPSLSFLQRTFEGEWSLLVECHWRLDGPKHVVASCCDALQPEPKTMPTLAEIEGLEVLRAHTAAPGFDLSLQFVDGHCLRCFATETTRMRNNWSFWGPHGAVVVGPKGRVVEETPGGLEAKLERHRLQVVPPEDDLVEEWRRHQDDRQTDPDSRGTDD